MGAGVSRRVRSAACGLEAVLSSSFAYQRLAVFYTWFRLVFVELNILDWGFTCPSQRCCGRLSSSSPSISPVCPDLIVDPPIRDQMATCPRGRRINHVSIGCSASHLSVLLRLWNDAYSSAAPFWAWNLLQAAYGLERGTPESRVRPHSISKKEAYVIIHGESIVWYHCRIFSA
ncbi:hypothetical protein LZ30DRAFT_368659 [Colletotrichum cereale]|nr:hypothetical protein LZ30DRAFT_368659 [Colletotrichum cereale]